MRPNRLATVDRVALGYSVFTTAEVHLMKGSPANDGSSTDVQGGLAIPDDLGDDHRSIDEGEMDLKKDDETCGKGLLFSEPVLIL